MREPLSGTQLQEALQARARLYRDIRSFFDGRDVLEVETPVLSRFSNPDPALDPVRTEEKPARWLRTSPEFPLKRLLSSGVRDCYEMGKVFRGLESGRHHNPEFTMLEWYRVGWTWNRLAEEVVALLQQVGGGRFDAWPVTWCSYTSLFETHTGLCPLSASADAWSRWATANGTHFESDDAREWLDLVFAQAIQPSLPCEAVTIVHHFPADQAALAQLDPNDSSLALRFEVFLGREELANGYQELTDPVEQQRRFEADNERRQRSGKRMVPVDHALIAGLQDGLPQCSGVALGVDRLLMALTGAHHINEVLAFPAEQA